MYKIETADRTYPDAAQLIFGGVTSRPPRHATLLLSPSLPAAERAALKAAFASSCGGCEESPVRLPLALGETAIRLRLDGMRSREVIRSDFLAAARGGCRTPALECR